MVTTLKDMEVSAASAPPAPSVPPRRKSRGARRNYKQLNATGEDGDDTNDVKSAKKKKRVAFKEITNQPEGTTGKAPAAAAAKTFEDIGNADTTPAAAAPPPPSQEYPSLSQHEKELHAQEQHAQEQHAAKALDLDKKDLSDRAADGVAAPRTDTWNVFPAAPPPPASLGRGSEVMLELSADVQAACRGHREEGTEEVTNSFKNRLIEFVNASPIAIKNGWANRHWWLIKEGYALKEDIPETAVSLTEVGRFAAQMCNDIKTSTNKNPAGVTLKCYFMSFCRLVLYEQEDWVAKHQIPSSTYKIQVIGMHLTEFAAAKNVIQVRLRM